MITVDAVLFVSTSRFVLRDIVNACGIYTVPYAVRRTTNLARYTEHMYCQHIYWKAGAIIYRGAEKSLARPGRKPATATELLQATQKQFRRLSVPLGLRGSNDSASDEKWRPFNYFFSRLGIRTYQHPCINVLQFWILTNIFKIFKKQKDAIRGWIQNFPDWCRHLHSSCVSAKHR